MSIINYFPAGVPDSGSGGASTPVIGGQVAFRFSGTARHSGRVITLLDSGTFNVEQPVTAEVFLVGGGGSGVSGYSGSTPCGGAGGGGGYTETFSNVSLEPGKDYTVTIGAGARYTFGSSSSHAQGSQGGSTYFDTLEAKGGYGGNSSHYGGNGGSGGGGYNTSGSGNPHAGGTDGGNGSGTSSGTGGTGQGRTTRAFGEAGGKLFSTGGSGAPKLGTSFHYGDTGGANTGNGGGGGYNFGAGGGGGSGIVMVRFPSTITIVRAV